MSKELEEAIGRLNNFKTIKVLYGNIFAMHLQQLEQLQNDVEIALKALDNLQKRNNKYMNAELFSAKQLKFIGEQNKKYFIHKKELQKDLKILQETKVDDNK